MGVAGLVGGAKREEQAWEGQGQVENGRDHEPGGWSQACRHGLIGAWPGLELGAWQGCSHPVSPTGLRAGQLQEQPLPQLPALLLRHPDDVQHGVALRAPGRHQGAQSARGPGPPLKVPHKLAPTNMVPHSRSNPQGPPHTGSSSPQSPPRPTVQLPPQRSVLMPPLRRSSRSWTSWC